LRIAYFIFISKNIFGKYERGSEIMGINVMSCIKMFDVDAPDAEIFRKQFLLPLLIWQRMALDPLHILSEDARVMMTQVNQEASGIDHIAAPGAMLEITPTPPPGRCI
jgi:hypothetical protein